MPTITLYIDSDGFPHTAIAVEIATVLGIKTIVAGNMTQNLDRFESAKGVEILKVSDGMDAADFAIFNLLQEGNILLTNDTGLAALALGKKAKVLDSKCHAFKEGSIDQRLMGRHLAKKVRRTGGRTRGPKKISDADRDKFAKRLELTLGNMAVNK
ncbi:MAG: DUF188 domain-containing protein [bacterium]|nr:DUF188 domain-containing protein [bacterium]